MFQFAARQIQQFYIEHIDQADTYEKKYTNRAPLTLALNV